ncbi:MAG TPA: helix-turn-helix transcriptional regulator [Ramlibacter sp.]|nr:helix-turn-helix transcriptional regulator [Ramlibacter sp.]
MVLALRSADSIARALGGRLRALRLARNLSQAELAAMAGASLSSVRRLESRGSGSLQLMVRAALALDAAHQLEELFQSPPALTIAQAEAAAATVSRQRARRSRRLP